jgi:hypothetical protein
MLLLTAVLGVGLPVRHSLGGTTSLKTRNVLLITTDGFRWQELFGGAEEALVQTNAVVKKVDHIRRQFVHTTPEARRQALLPFFWNTIAKQGQIWGNTNLGSIVQVANRMRFSYPGYNELLTGIADPRIDSNDKKPNPNTNVLEWLDAKPAFRRRCAAFASWDVIPYVLNRDRNGLYARGGIEPMAQGRLTPRQELLNTLIAETTPLWDGLLHDSFTFHGALDYFKEHKPRVLYVAFDETDDWAHDERYDRYLQAAHRVDDYVRQLWELVQSLPGYRDRTTLLISTDHGRGSGPKAWREHGKTTAGAEFIWLAALGPDTAPLGERRHTEPVEQRQIAATVAALVGEDYNAAFPAAGRTIAELLKK